jgi:sporulation protein YlmC with PRC-barrel domain
MYAFSMAKRAVFFVLLLILSPLNDVCAQSLSKTEQFNTHPAKHGVAKTQSGKDIGSVIDFIIDLPTGRILFAVVTPTSIQSKTTAVVLLPWSLAEVDSTGSQFTFAITTDTVRNAPQLSAKTWKQPPRLQWLTGAERYWHTHATKSLHLTSHSTSILGKATTLIGVHVHGADNTVLGTIRELIFDPDDGAIALVVLAQTQGAHVQSHIEFLSLPWDHLYVEPVGNRLIAVAGQKVLT